MKPALHYTICNYVIYNEILDNLTIIIKTEWKCFKWKISSKFHKKKMIYSNGIWRWFSESEMTYSGHLDHLKNSVPRLPKYIDESVICKSLWHIEFSDSDIQT